MKNCSLNEIYDCFFFLKRSPKECEFKTQDIFFEEETQTIIVPICWIDLMSLLSWELLLSLMNLLLTNISSQLQKFLLEDHGVLEGQQYHMIMSISMKVTLT